MEYITDLFTQVLSFSLMGTILAGVIYFTKVLFKDKFSASWHYYIWLLLVLRLIIPFSPESSLSIFNLLPVASYEVNSFNTSVQSVVNIPKDIFPKETSNSNVTVKDSKESNDSSIEVTSQLTNKPLFSNDQQSPTSQDRIPYQLNYFQLFSILWAIGVLFFILYIIVINLVFYLKIKRQKHEQDGEILGILKQAKDVMNIKRNIPILQDSYLNTPSLFGLLKPKLLMPATLMSRLTKEEKRYIFLHELAHLKRKDILISFITSLVQAVHWFNPFLWYSFRKLHEDQEVACDAFVLKKLHQDEHSKYGQTVINLLKFMSKPYWNPLHAGMASKKTNIKRRIIMIADFKRTSWKWSLLGLLVIILLVTVTLTNANTGDSTDKKSWEVLSRAYTIQGTVTEINIVSNHLESLRLDVTKQLPLNNNPVDSDFTGKNLPIIFNESIDNAGELKSKLHLGSELVVTFSQYAIDGIVADGAFLKDLYSYEDGKYYNVKGEIVDLAPADDTEFLNQPKIEVPVDIEMERYNQEQVEDGKDKWRLDPIEVTKDYLSQKFSVAKNSIEYYEFQRSKHVAIIGIVGEGSPTKYVYLKHMIKQGDTGIWTVVGYDPYPVIALPSFKGTVSELDYHHMPLLVIPENKFNTEKERLADKYNNRETFLDLKVFDFSLTESWVGKLENKDFQLDIYSSGGSLRLLVEKYGEETRVHIDPDFGLQSAFLFYDDHVVLAHFAKGLNGIYNLKSGDIDDDVAVSQQIQQLLDNGNWSSIKDMDLGKDFNMFGSQYKLIKTSHVTFVAE